jgi:hypothetical protein
MKGGPKQGRPFFCVKPPRTNDDSCPAENHARGPLRLASARPRFEGSALRKFPRSTREKCRLAKLSQVAKPLIHRSALMVRTSSRKCAEYFVEGFRGSPMLLSQVSELIAKTCHGSRAIGTSGPPGGNHRVERSGHRRTAMRWLEAGTARGRWIPEKVYPRCPAGVRYGLSQT